MIELHSTSVSNSWVLETGCGTHICSNCQGLKESRTLKHGELNLIMGNRMTATVTKIRDLELVLSSGLSINELDKSSLWHHRLGHINKKRIAKLQSDGILESFDLKSDEKCESCLFGKMTKSPFKGLMERGKDLLDLIHTDRKTNDKLEPRAEKCLFVGYPYKSFGYIFYKPSENKVFVARRGVFQEREFISKEDSGSNIDLGEIQETTNNEPIVDTSPQHEVESPVEETNITPPPLRRTSRVSKVNQAPEYYYGFHITKEGDTLVNDKTFDSADEPSNYKEAMAGPEAAKWKEAMESEIQSMYNNHVWELVDHTPGRKTVGYTQTQGIDYDETFSLVAKIKSIRILLAIIAFHDYEIWQMDVKTAFLNGKLDEDVYMAQPEGFVHAKYPDKVSEIHRVLLYDSVMLWCTPTLTVTGSYTGYVQVGLNQPSNTYMQIPRGVLEVYAQFGIRISYIKKKLLRIRISSLFHRLYSDHCPIFLDCNRLDFGPVPFRFYNSSLLVDSLKLTVIHAWSDAESGSLPCSPKHNLCRKLKRTKEAVKVWKRTFHPGRYKDIRDLKTKIGSLDLMSEVRCLTECERAEKISLLANLKELEKLEVKILNKWQKSGGSPRGTKILLSITELSTAEKIIEFTVSLLTGTGSSIRMRLKDWFSTSSRTMDFEKAFDNVNWNFLFDVLALMNFGRKWISWVKELVTTASVLVLVNGSPTNQFRLEKGIRQGDPMSPYLFILAIEGLITILKESSRNGLLKGVDLPNNGPKLVSLHYADDALFLGEWSDQNVRNLMQILHCYHLVSGLKINWSKSILLGVKVAPNDIMRVAMITSWKEGRTPFTYLGMSIGSSMNKSTGWHLLLEKFRNRLSSWKGKHLSAGGKITLCKSVLGSLGVYLFSLFKAPTIILNKLEGMGRNFFLVADRLKKSGSGNMLFWNWRRPLLEGRETRETDILVDLCRNFPISEGDEKWRWSLENSGFYFAASLRLAIDDMGLKRAGSPTIWNLAVPTKVLVSELELNSENYLTMDTQETVLVSKVPMLKPNEFDMWKIRIRQYMLLTDYGMWEVVENGPGIDEGAARPPPRTDADRKRRQTEMKALSTLLLAIPNEYQHQFSTYTDAKSLWTALEKRFSGTKSTKRNQKAILKQQYENFTSLKNESMTQTFDRFNKLIGELATVDVKMDKDDGDDLEDKELEDLYNDLRIFEAEVEKKKRPIGYTHNTALLSSENPSSFNTTAFNNTTAANETVSNVYSCSSQEINEDTVLEAFLASHVKSSLINDDLDQINADDLEEMDIKWQMAMITLRMKRFIRRTGRNNFDLKRGDKAGFDKSKVRCYKCNEPGHFARECKGVTTNNQNNGSGSAQAPRFNNRGSNSNPSSSQALVSQEGQGFDWSDHVEEAVQNQALMAEIKETNIPTEVSSKLCSDSCLETVKKYRDHNQTMSDSIKKMERERREYVKIIDNLEDQIKAYKANELQFEYDHNYWKWEKKELERKLSKEKEEVESARKELSKAKEDLDKFSKSSKALESIIRVQVTDDLKRGGMPEEHSEEEFDKKSTSETIPEEHQILTNEKGGMPFVPSKKIETTRKDKGKSVMSSENKGKKTETPRKESRKDHYIQRTVVEPGTSSQSQNKNHPRGNKRNWNNHWAQCHGVDLSKINRPKPCFICCKTNHLARDCYFNPFNQRNSYQARRVVPTHKKVVPKQNRSSKPKRKVQKKKVEKKSIKLVTKWVPKASLSNTTASTSSGNNSVASDSSGNSINSVEVNTAVSNISSNNSTTATSQVNTAVSNNSSGNSNNVTTDKSSLRKPIITKYSSHEIPNKDYLLKLNRLTESNQGRRSSLWHVDSGCSRHMTGIMSLLEDFKKFEGGHVAFGDNPNGGKISGKGKFVTRSLVYFSLILNVILAPGNKIDESKVMLRTPRKDNVYCLDIEDASSLTSLNCLFSKASVSESSLWHRRMCHMNFKNMNLLVKNNLVRGLPAKEFSSDDHCVACLKGKQHKNSHKSKEVNTISSPLQLLHMDLFGPTNVMSIGKKSYCLVIVDDYSRFTWVYFLRTKDETSGLIKPFVTRVENKTNLRVKVIRSDNGTEFKNADLNSFCEEKGIERQYSAPRTPQQNGVAERRNRTLIEAARTRLANSKLPITFWAEAVNTACYVQNKVLIVKSKGKIPYELFEKKKPYIGFLQAFGCPCTILDTKTHLGKFESKSDDGFFVGYSSQSKALRVFNSSTRIIEESDNVKCNENTPNIPGSGPNWLFDIDSLTNSLNMSYTVNADSGTEQAQETSPTFVMFPMPCVDSNDTCTTDESTVDDHTESGSAEKIDDQPIEESSPSQNLEGIPALEEGPQLDLEPEVNDSNLGVDLTEEPLYLTRTQKNHPPTLTEPKKAHDAMKDPSWIEAMQEELLQFVLQHVWDLVDLPKGHRVIGTKWIFRNKTDERDIVIKNKARLVAQGYTQEEGIDYDDVFARVARIEAIRLFLAFASYKGFKVYQMDVKSAFLYGTIDEEVYVSQPPGFEDPKYPDKVYKLRKALYGLHQAPRAWYDTLSSYLLENKFEIGVIDKTLFIKRTKTDMLLVKQKTDGIFINQSKYVATMLQKFGMNDAKPASTPMETHKHLTADVEGEEVDVHHYRSMIGSLMYLTASRPDIMFAVCVCARYQVRPKESHLHAVKRIFKYLKGQPRLGLWYPNDSSFDLVAYTDSDYGGANLDRKSTSGGCQFLGGRLVSWQCKKQTIVSQSTTEAEYIAASQCCSQVLWIQNQMQDYGLSFLQTPIYIDNNSAISIVNNPVKHSKTKHVEIKYHFIRDCNEKKLIQVLKVHTDDQYADLFTKAFDVGRFTFLVTGVGMMNSE
ncbi:hypothetical protein OSB04_012927 [Centaurea solstitialis]|uniref:Uncharacterized protein n=1 Tax=Centaurea solstitialis TaxID=347529 RepID=A0AA38TCB2_9ASTR|nr:hypothetical protein OSB04_012927 [Centaurea solstitialis]